MAVSKELNKFYLCFLDSIILNKGLKFLRIILINLAVTLDDYL